MLPLARSTAAVVVVHGLDSDPRPLIDELRHSVGRTIVADNSPRGHPALATLEAGSDLVELRTGNRGALAGAYNQAVEHLAAHHPEITYLVFIDEDTEVSGMTRLLADPQVQQVLGRSDTAAVAPVYVDRATGMRGKYIELSRWTLRFLPRRFEGLREVAFVINSMSIWRIDALRRIGRFDEGLAIDHVDTEYCLRARHAGLHVYVHGGHEFAHSIGQRRRFRLLGRDMQAGGHSPSRRYLIGRNTAWLGRRYLFREPAFACLCLSRLGYEAVGITLAEDGKLAKLAALVRGALTGLVAPRLHWQAPTR